MRSRATSHFSPSWIVLLRRSRYGELDLGGGMALARPSPSAIHFQWISRNCASTRHGYYCRISKRRILIATFLYRGLNCVQLYLKVHKEYRLQHSIRRDLSPAGFALSSTSKRHSISSPYPARRDDSGTADN